MLIKLYKKDMATILDELIEELNAKEKRIAKEIINIDRSSVIPEHTNKAQAILDMTNEAIKVKGQSEYLSILNHEKDTQI
jgi:23S rRNA maturation mini-RNase III